jgi:group I intron endonuclease
MSLFIYKMTSPSNKVYIGITSVSLHRRRLHHECLARKNKGFKIHAAIRKYGDKNTWKIIEEVQDWQTAKTKEQYYIKLYNSYANGYNATVGGDTAHLYRKPKYGKDHHRYGKKMSPETRQQISNSIKGKKRTPEQNINQCIQMGVTAFDVFTKSDVLLGTWINRAECARELGLTHSCILACLSGRRKTHKGLTFRLRGNK